MHYFKNLTAIIVLYNTSDLVLDCLNKIKNINIIIVDNGRNNIDLINLIKQKYKVIKYFKPKRNLGFGRACNFAFRYIKTKYTLLIEPDVFVDENSLINLISTLDKYPEAGMATPSFVDTEYNSTDFLGHFQEKGKGISRNKFEENINLRLSKNLPEGDCCIYFCLAAILLLNNKIMKKVGLFNRKMFLYWEDFDLCRKLFTNKIPIIKSYNSKAIHLERQSVKSSIINKFIMTLHNDKSAFIYFNLKKNDFILKKRFFLYLFRFISYLFIFNFRKSIKNLARICAIYFFIKK